MLNNLLNALLNTLFVSIPEEFVWVALTLLFLKRKNLLDYKRWKSNIKYIMLPVVPTSIVINIFKYIIQGNYLLMYIISGVILYTTLLWVVKKTQIEEENFIYLRTLGFAFLSVLLGVIITDLIYGLILLTLIHQPIEYIKYINSIFTLNFVACLPLRIFEFMVLFIIIYKVNLDIETRFFKYIFKDKVMAISTIVFLGLIVLVTGIVMNYLMYYNYVATIAIVILLSLVGVVGIIPVNHLLRKLFKMQQSQDNMFVEETDVNI